MCSKMEKEKDPINKKVFVQEEKENYIQKERKQLEIDLQKSW